MNTPTPAQALGECLELVRKWPNGCNDTSALIEASVTFFLDHGQHFAGLEREVELLRARVKMMDDFHDALANEFHACGCVMGEGPKVVNARAEEAERLALKLSSWIIRSGLDPWQIKDHACAQCAPDSDIVKAGFACAYHEAAAFLAARG